MRDDWIEHRRGLDGELLGWMRPDGEGFVVVDLLGRDRTAALDWLDAEAALDELGIGYLADIYELRLDDAGGADAGATAGAGGAGANPGTGAGWDDGPVDGWLRVRIAEVSPAGIRVKKDDGGAVGAPQIYYDLPFPAPATLRPRAR